MSGGTYGGEMANDDPSQVSSAYARMQPGWALVDDILAGPATIRARGEAYLPKNPNEDTKEYQRRLKSAPWRPEFVDILSSLASKPFSKEITLEDGASARIKELCEDIDARGSNLTAFAREVFREGIARGQHAILVDFPSLSRTLTQAEERQAGVRPYWVSLPSTAIIALRTEFIGGKEIISHVRIKECVTEADGYGEVEVERIRELEPGLWRLWEKRKVDGVDGKWAQIGEGKLSLPVVPLVIFRTGRREGSHFVRPPLDALADAQIELYRALSRLEEAYTFAGSPMLSANGFTLPKSERVVVGPSAVLFAPPSRDGVATSWNYVQPDAANLTELRESVRALTDDIRRLGMQPLTQRSGGVTATATSVEAAKAHSTVEAWALGLKDCLEQALVFTSMWLGEGDKAAEVDVNTDFSVEPHAQPALDALEKGRARGDISRKTYWQGLRRYDVLPPDFDPEVEAEEIEAEGPALGEMGDEDEPPVDKPEAA